MKTKCTTKTLIALAAFTLALPLLAQEGSSGQPKLGRKSGLLVSATGRIEAIDYTNREVTIKDRAGHTETISVGEEVKRLDEAKVGDTVTLEYYLGFAAELRKPTAEEAQHPLTFLEAGGKASKEEAPAAGGVRRIKAVVTIEGLDRPTQTVTVKGPMGRYFVARVADPSRLEQARIGETIVVTLTEAAAVSLNKVDKKGSD